MQAGKQSWSQLSSTERLERRWASFLAPGVAFASPEAGAAYDARARRIKTATMLEGTPDRVPVCALTQFFPAVARGLTPYEAMYDYKRAAEAWLSVNRDLQPDTLIAPLYAAIPGRMYDLLDVRILNWPGHGVAKEAVFQYNEQEWMRADEYDLLIDDPTDFLLHVYLPRVAGALRGFSKLVSPLDMIEIVVAPTYVKRWADPQVRETVAKLTEAGQEAAEWAGTFFPLLGQLVSEGFPGPVASMSLAPFDFIGDTLRGTRGILMDMFRQPDVLLEACDRVARIVVKWVTRNTTPATPPLVFIPLHKGADGFMSLEQFKTFYWPSLKKVIAGLVEDGFIPYLFAEGAYNSRLETIADVPRARTVWHFDQTDMRRAKSVLGDVACIQGNVPSSLLQLAGPEEVTAYCLDLIQAVGQEGGFILDVGAAADDTKEANLRAMIQAAKEYVRQ